MNLNDVRKRIDSIDNQILDLFEKRMDAARTVAEIKMKENLPIFNADRENIILESVETRAGEHGAAAKVLFSSLMDISRAFQHELVSNEKTLRLKKSITGAPIYLDSTPIIACQGAKASYSHTAVQKFFPGSEPLFYKSFEDVFEAVKNGAAKYGVLPVENSSAGSVIEVYDLILKYKFYIVGAAEIAVNHCLMGIQEASIDTITEVYSHPQALMQCSEFIRKHGFKAYEDTNTAVAAKHVAEKNETATGVIASEAAAKQYGLKVLYRDINNYKNNRTRFILISKNLIIPENADKISLTFQLPHTTGSLYRILSRFAAGGLNLTKIESRPMKNSKFEYQFYLDFSGDVKDKGILSLVSSLQADIPFFVFLGNYHEYAMGENK